MRTAKAGPRPSAFRVSDFGPKAKWLDLTIDGTDEYDANLT